MELGDLLHASWDLFDQLQHANLAPDRTVLPTKNSCGVGGSYLALTDDAVLVTLPDSDGDDEPERQGPRVHVCGSRCEYLHHDDDGSYVCTKTGRVFGRQLCFGPTDARLMAMGACPVPAQPPLGAKRRRNVNYIASHEDVFSACVQMTNKLLTTNQRRAADAERLEKAMRIALRVATAARPNEPCALRLLFKVYTEVEKNGATLMRRDVTRQDCDRIARLQTLIYHEVAAPYTKVDTHRPTAAYFSAAMCYLMSTDVMGGKLHVPLLAAHMPEEKSLKQLGIIVSRVTMAKRWTLQAIKHFVATFKGADV